MLSDILMLPLMLSLFAAITLLMAVAMPLRHYDGYCHASRQIFLLMSGCFMAPY